ncbi:MAG: hypothetical protein U1E97_01510 [Alphaproteobacteria bacterium]
MPAETLVRHLTWSQRRGAVAFATEAGLFQEAGLPAVARGPGSIDQAWSPNEYIDEIGQVEACAALFSVAWRTGCRRTARIVPSRRSNQISIGCACVLARFCGSAPAISRCRIGNAARTQQLAPLAGGVLQVSSDIR